MTYVTTYIVQRDIVQRDIVQRDIVQRDIHDHIHVVCFLLQKKNTYFDDESDEEPATEIKATNRAVGTCIIQCVYFHPYI